MKTRVWHISIALIVALVFISLLSAGLSSRSAQALSAARPIELPKSIGLASVALASAAMRP